MSPHRFVTREASVAQDCSQIKWLNEPSGFVFSVEKTNSPYSVPTQPKFIVIVVVKSPC